MPYGVNPLSFTTGLYSGLARLSVACCTVSMMSAFICSTSTPALAVNGTDTKHSFDGSSFSSDAVLRMEFGMTIRPIEEYHGEPVYKIVFIAPNEACLTEVKRQYEDQFVFCESLLATRAAAS